MYILNKLVNSSVINELIEYNKYMPTLQYTYIITDEIQLCLYTHDIISIIITITIIIIFLFILLFCLRIIPMNFIRSVVRHGLNFNVLKGALGRFLMISLSHTDVNIKPRSPSLWLSILRPFLFPASMKRYLVNGADIISTEIFPSNPFFLSRNKLSLSVEQSVPDAC